jgi:hypothetical protein
MVVDEVREYLRNGAIANRQFSNVEMPGNRPSVAIASPTPNMLGQIPPHGAPV